MRTFFSSGYSLFRIVGCWRVYGSERISRSRRAWALAVPGGFRDSDGPPGRSSHNQNIAHTRRSARSRIRSTSNRAQKLSTSMLRAERCSARRASSAAGSDTPASSKSTIRTRRPTPSRGGDDGRVAAQTTRGGVHRGSTTCSASSASARQLQARGYVPPNEYVTSDHGADTSRRHTMILVGCEPGWPARPDPLDMFRAVEDTPADSRIPTAGCAHRSWMRILSATRSKQV
jgi:hypothetical protein